MEGSILTKLPDWIPHGKHRDHKFRGMLCFWQILRMDGYEATKIIRALNDPRSRIPIIAMTANAFEEDRQRAFEAGMDAHIAKPIDVKILFSTLAQVLGEE